ncbi:MAG: outer membrane lipoprotein carrier protein LolA [Alphaproteobacteria bacterium]|nr:outer membrane lipoprotein carrier protein LolA [Alphaproteobacteria bacterium]
MFKALLFVLCLTMPAFADQPVQEKQLTADQQQLVEKIENYFNSIRTIKSKFYQSSDNGGSAQGDFYVSKPNKMRLEYQPPHPIEVVADGYYLIFHDKKLEQVTYLDLDDNPAAMILKENFSFKTDDLAITGITTEPGEISVSVIKKSQPSAGRITLIFKDKPLALKQWRVTDAQQITTVVTLDNVEINTSLDSQLFKFKDPRKKGRPGDIPRRR